MNETEDQVLARAQARTDRINAVNAEWRAVQAWKAAGSVGEKPATPTMDAVLNETGEHFKPLRGFAAAVKSNGHGTKPGRKAIEPTPGHRFFRNDRPFSDSDNTLSSVAYQCTKGLDGERKRISTSELETLLKAAGIENPRTDVWEHTLANGIKLSARIVDGGGVLHGIPPLTGEQQALVAAAKAVLGKISEPLTLPKSKSTKVDLRKDDLADAIVKATPPKRKSRAKSTPALPVLDALMSPIVKPSKKETFPATFAGVKKAKTEAPKRQPRKGNKPVVGIKPPARSRAR
jgi:hypothetical protein